MSPPPARRQNGSDPDGSIGELSRLIAALTRTVEQLVAKVDGLGREFTPREVHDLAVGGVKIDIRRIDEERAKDAEDLRDTARKLGERLDEAEREVAKRFRQSVLLIVTAIVAPLTVAIVVLVLTSLVSSGPVPS